MKLTYLDLFMNGLVILLLVYIMVLCFKCRQPVNEHFVDDMASESLDSEDGSNPKKHHGKHHRKHHGKHKDKRKGKRKGKGKGKGKKHCCKDEQCKKKDSSLPYCVYKRDGKLYNCGGSGSKKKCKKDGFKCYCSDESPTEEM